MKFGLKSLLVLISILAFSSSNGQNIVEEYQKAKNDSLRIGELDSDFLKYIEKGYTLATPENGTNITGVIIFFEGSEFDKKNMLFYLFQNKYHWTSFLLRTQF